MLQVIVMLENLVIPQWQLSCILFYMTFKNTQIWLISHDTLYSYFLSRGSKLSPNILLLPPCLMVGEYFLVCDLQLIFLHTYF